MEWSRAHPDIVPDRAIPDDPEDYGYGIWLTGFNSAVERFQERTGIKLYRSNITLKTTNGELYVNATRVLDNSGLSPLDISAAILECYRQIDAYTRFLREDIPGFEHCRLGPVAPVLGVRETRHILGAYVLTGHDVTRGTRFDDSVMADISAHDIHDVKGDNVDFRGLTPYEVPYRCFVPRELPNLLVAGRCISVDHVAHGRTRNMPACMAGGQAAGIAAALSIRTERTVREVDVGRVQRVLEQIRMPIHAEELM